MLVLDKYFGSNTISIHLPVYLYLKTDDDYLNVNSANNICRFILLKSKPKQSNYLKGFVKPTQRFHYYM